MPNLIQRWTAYSHQHSEYLGYRSTWDKLSITIVEGSFTQVKTWKLWKFVDWINNIDMTKYIILGKNEYEIYYLPCSMYY